MEAIVVHATVEGIARADKMVADVFAHQEAEKVEAAIQNQRVTVVPRAASKEELGNAVIVAEVVTA